MTVSIGEIDSNLIGMIESQTGLLCGDHDVPIRTGLQGQSTEPDWTDTFYILYRLTTPTFEGALGDANSLASIPYQVSVVGGTAEAVRLATDRLVGALTNQWSLIPWVMGPPSVSVGAMLRDQERSYRAIVSLTMEGTGT